MIPAAVPHPRLTLAHRFTRDKQIWVGRAVGFLQCADGAMSFGLREGIALALALLWIGALSLTALGFGGGTIGHRYQARQFYIFAPARP